MRIGGMRHGRLPFGTKRELLGEDGGCRKMVLRARLARVIGDEQCGRKRLVERKVTVDFKSIAPCHKCADASSLSTMENLSFTTFLKLCLLPTTQAKTGALQRMHTSSGGYDFYKRMKLAAYEVAAGKMDPDDILAQLSSIGRQTEREHNIYVATRFRDWWLNKASEGCTPNSDRPSGIFGRQNLPFKIRLKPELRYTEGTSDKVVYLWATAAPALTKQVAASGIIILQEAFANTSYSKIDFGILDLRKGKIFNEDSLNNTSKTNLDADLAQIGAIWSQVS